MKISLAVLLYLLVATIPATAQQTSPTNRWFFENATYAVQPVRVGGAEFTTGRISYGNTTRVLYRSLLGNRLSLATGLGIVVQQLRQRSELDQYVCAANLLGCLDTPADFVVAEHNALNLEVPLQLRAYLNRQQRGMYLLGGAAVQLPLFNLPSVYAVADDGTETIVPEGEIDAKTAVYASSGLGYERRVSDRMAWYLEVVASWSLNPVLGESGLQDSAGNLNYLQTSRVRQLGLTGGLNF